MGRISTTIGRTFLHAFRFRFLKALNYGTQSVSAKETTHNTANLHLQVHHNNQTLESGSTEPQRRCTSIPGITSHRRVWIYIWECTIAGKTLAAIGSQPVFPVEFIFTPPVRSQVGEWEERMKTYASIFPLFLIRPVHMLQRRKTQFNRRPPVRSISNAPNSHLLNYNTSKLL